MNLKLIGRYKDPDSTEKYIFQNSQGTIEITRINTKADRDIFCVPSLYGCTLGCNFCFLTTLKITNNNNKINYDTIKECLTFVQNPKQKRQISIMGVGDPSLNMEFISQACAEEESVSIATIFPINLPILPLNLKIHYSLHSSIQENRLKMMPSAKIEIESAFEYLNSHGGKKEVHYTLINGQNDTNAELDALVSLVQKYPLNVKFLDFKESSNLKKSTKINDWMAVLSKYTTVEFYNPPGEKIQGSCGQFTKVFYQKGYEQQDEFKQFEKEYSF